VRNCELAGKLEGITPKMPRRTLRVLVRDGLVRREIFPVIPPRVEYELTEPRPDPDGAAQSDEIPVGAACA
jgi:DNA-binding HxlR family transcriptional regulator